MGFTMGLNLGEDAGREEMRAHTLSYQSLDLRPASIVNYQHAQVCGGGASGNSYICSEVGWEE